MAALLHLISVFDINIMPCDGLATCPGCTNPASRPMTAGIGSSDLTDGLSGDRKWIVRWISKLYSTVKVFFSSINSYE